MTNLGNDSKSLYQYFEIFLKSHRVTKVFFQLLLYDELCIDNHMSKYKEYNYLFY